MAYFGERWARYVPVAERRRKALGKMDQLRKQGVDVQPVALDGSKIAQTFWGAAWCDHMESLGDFANRLPRGRTYLRNGSVCHLEIAKGRVKAMVSGSTLYKIDVTIDTLPKSKWEGVKRRCAGEIGSLIELLQGRFSDNVMQVVTDRAAGLFPSSSEIHLKCDCPDWSRLCKHLAAVLYGVGSRLDNRPELLFLLRGVDHDELINARVDSAVSSSTERTGRRKRIVADDLSEVFGVEIENGARACSSKGNVPAARPRKTAAKKSAATKARAGAAGSKSSSAHKKAVLAKTATGSKKATAPPKPKAAKKKASVKKSAGAKSTTIVRPAKKKSKQSRRAGASKAEKRSFPRKRA